MVDPWTAASLALVCKGTRRAILIDVSTLTTTFFLGLERAMRCSMSSKMRRTLFYSLSTDYATLDY